MKKINKAPWLVHQAVAKSSILKLKPLHLESTIELLAESQYHFIWRVDEIIKSSIEFSWDFELESDDIKTNFFYTMDLNGNKVLVIHFHLVWLYVQFH